MRNFGEMLGTIRNNCAHLNPLPHGCERRFRSSFCRKSNLISAGFNNNSILVPEGFEVGRFNVTRERVQYAAGIYARPIGIAALPGVA